MQKIFKKILALFLAGSFLSIPLAQAKFFDVEINHKNAIAISYLEQHGIINGYPDGTFKPDNLVNRAEFLKIIIEGSKISKDVEKNTIFFDVDNNSWYGPYVKKAFAEGWINGYGDGTFRPDQTINKVEALKILALIQEWQLAEFKNSNPFLDTPEDAWYVNYVSFAKSHGYLEESGNFFFPAQKMTRAQISEIIYRTLVNEKSQDNSGQTLETSNGVNETPEDNLTETSPPETPTATPQEKTDQEKAFTPVVSKNIPANFYKNISLDEDLPNIFYKNEIYIVKGEVPSNGTEVTIIMEDPNNSYYKTFDGEIKNNHFEIPVYFSQSGNYSFGIIPGESGESKAAKISVLSKLPAPPKNQNIALTASSLNVSYQNDQTSVNFTAPDSTLKRLNFYQNDQKVTYFSRQNTSYLPVKYSDFSNFKETQVNYYLETAKLNLQSPLTIASDFVSTDTKSFTATKHNFDDILEDKIVAVIPDTLSVPTQFSFTAKANTDTKQQSFIITPDGVIDEIDLTPSVPAKTNFGIKIIEKGTNFNFSYKPSRNGIYILEINDSNGEPIVNHPIYIGSEIPLIPDFFDLLERKFFKETFDLSKLRQQLLELINTSREQAGSKQLILDNELNTLAQNHSDDMVKEDYFSHINLKNQTPDDRRLALGVKTYVGENIAKDTSILAAHFGLMRSAGHLKTILEPDWDRIGLGISLDEGHLVVTEEFSTRELKSYDLQNYRNELFNAINDKRTQNNLNQLTDRPSLDLTSKYLNDKAIKENATLTNELFSKALQENNISGSSEAIGKNYSIWSEVFNSILETEDTLLSSIWKTMGIDLQLDSNGNIHTIIIINNSN